MKDYFERGEVAVFKDSLRRVSCSSSIAKACSEDQRFADLLRESATREDKALFLRSFLEDFGVPEVHILDSLVRDICEKENFIALGVLLDCVPDLKLNSPDQGGQTPLQVVFKKAGPNIRFFKLMLANGADPNSIIVPMVDQSFTIANFKKFINAIFASDILSSSKRVLIDFSSSQQALDSLFSEHDNMRSKGNRDKKIVILLDKGVFDSARSYKDCDLLFWLMMKGCSNDVVKLYIEKFQDANLNGAISGNFTFFTFILCVKALNMALMLQIMIFTITQE